MAHTPAEKSATPTSAVGVTTFGGTSVKASFNQPPSKFPVAGGGFGGDIPAAQANTLGVKGSRYVLGTGNKTAYTYNGSGTIATFPLKKFLNVKAK